MILVLTQIVNALFALVPIALCFALFSAIMLCVRWKTQHRRKHAKRLGISLAVVPITAGAIYAITWFVLMPAMASEMTAHNDLEREKRFATTTLVEVGGRSPDLTLNTIAGDKIVIPQRNKIVLVTFFATWCGPCRTELPHVQQIWESRRNDECFQIVAINREESESVIDDFLKTNDYSFPVVADTEREIYSQFATESIPRTFVIDSDGTIAYATIGFTDGDQNELNKILDNLLSAMPNDGR